jgi:hypothetical protein
MTMQLAIMEWFVAWVLVARALCVLNAMTWRTWLPVKVAYIALALAAFGLIAAPFYGHELDDYAHPLLTCAIGAIMLIDRRFGIRLNLNT